MTVGLRQHLCTFVSEEQGKGKGSISKKHYQRGGKIRIRDVDFFFPRLSYAWARYLAVVAYSHCALGQSFLIELPSNLP